MPICSVKVLPKISFIYLDHVLRFFDKSNFKEWPDKIESVVYRWGNDKQRFIDEVKQKKIEVLIGNIPATAYETFREIARALPEVQFIPSLDSQFANKSKENVTHLCEKYHLAVPKTRIFYQQEQARSFLATSNYPKIIKKSYGPSNYGGYFVHKVDSYEQAIQLLKEKKYNPIYVQDFIPMAADIRVMLVGHKPVCAFWRRPEKGDWLTNTSQGGTMDYQDVPTQVLDLAVATSKAAKAEYWACDVAVGKDGQYRILECATAFAAFPYIRDWIGQYLMWQLSAGHFDKPHIPNYNWEELGKIDSSLLRTMRYITFGQKRQAQSQDCDELFNKINNDGFPILATKPSKIEEWPSEIWNFQDNIPRQLSAAKNGATYQQLIEPASTPVTKRLATEEGCAQKQTGMLQLNESHLYRFFDEVKGIGHTLAQNIIKTLGTVGVVDALLNDPEKLTRVKYIKDKKLLNITQHWQVFSKTL